MLRVNIKPYEICETFVVFCVYPAQPMDSSGIVNKSINREWNGLISGTTNYFFKVRRKEQASLLNLFNRCEIAS